MPWPDLRTLSMSCHDLRTLSMTKVPYSGIMSEHWPPAPPPQASLKHGCLIDMIPTPTSDTEGAKYSTALATELT